MEIAALVMIALVIAYVMRRNEIRIHPTLENVHAAWCTCRECNPDTARRSNSK